MEWHKATRPCQYETQTHDVHLRKCLKKMLWASQDWWLHCQCHTQDGRGNPFLSNTSASLWMGFPEVFGKLCDYVHVQKMNLGVPHIEINLVGGFNPSEKYDRQIGSFPQVEVINKKSLKSPPIVNLYRHNQWFSEDFRSRTFSWPKHQCDKNMSSPNLKTLSMYQQNARPKATSNL